MSIGDVTTLDTPVGDRVVLTAATFTGAGHTIVRLVPENLLEAETLAQETVGLTLRETVPVGHVRQRAVGFPAWPIITDPTNARHALNLVGDLEWARRHAENQAKKVKDRFDHLAGELTRSAPHFVPTLLEELARIFFAVGNATFARQYFGRARDVERAHGVPVDSARHEAVFLEFAQSGVVGAKQLTQEAGDAAARASDPVEAYRYVLGLNTARLTAGQPPYAHMMRDLRRLGAAAGIEDVDAEIFDSIIGLSSLHRAPAGFWRAAHASLVTWLRRNPDRAEFFVDSTPEALSIENWLAFLEETGAWDRLIADRERYLTWLSGVLQRSPYGLAVHSPRLIAAVERAGDGLAGVKLEAGFNWMPLELIDALCAAGISGKTDPGGGYRWVNWEDWVTLDEHIRDLVALADTPQVASLAEGALDPELIGEYLDRLLASPGARTLVSRMLDGLARRVEKARGSLPELAHLLDHHLRHLTDPRLTELNPGAMKTLTSFDPAASLAAALRCGLPAELAWPALEESAARLQREYPESQVSLHASYPRVLVVCGDAFELVEDERIILTGRLPVVDAEIENAFSVGEDLAVVYRPPGTWETWVYWHGHTAVPVTETNYFYLQGMEVTLPVPEGVLISTGLLTPGDTRRLMPAVLLSNGERHFRVDWEVLREWRAGAFDGEFRAAEVAEALGIPEIDDSVLLQQSQILPAHNRDSLTGNRDGVHLALRRQEDGVTRLLTPLGEFDASADARLALSRPGGGTWLVGRDRLLDAATGTHLSRHSGLLDLLPLTAYHQVRPRDPALSRRLREFTREHAQELLDAAVPDPHRTVDYSGVCGYDEPAPTTPLDNAAAARVLGTTDPVVLTAVAHMAADALTLREGFTALTGGASEEDMGTVPEHALRLLADLSFVVHLGFSFEDVRDALRGLPTRLQGGYTGRDLPYSAGVFRLIGHERTLLRLLSAPALDPVEVRDLSDLLRQLVADGVLCSGWRSHLCLQDPARPLQTNTWVDGAYIVENLWRDDEAHHLVLAPGDPASIDGRPVLPGPDDRMEAAEFLAGLDRLEPPDDVEKQVEALHTGTNLSRAAAEFFIRGLATFTWTPGSSERNDAHRLSLGLSAKDHERARDELHQLPGHVLLAMAAAPDGESAAEAWRTATGDLGHRLSASERTSLQRAVGPYMSADIDRILLPLTVADDQWYSLHRYIAPLLTLAALRRSDDPIRPFLAGQFAWIRTFLAQKMQDPHIRRSFPGELGGPFSDLGHQHELQSVRVLTEGVLDELLADLGTVYDSPPGHPMDPAVSAPGVLAQVQESLALDEDAARYFLQILTLPAPTDAGIRDWNGWRKKDIDAAAAPLVERGLLVEARRTGAARSRFLPGGWLEPSTGERGLEVWKAPLYLLWRDSRMRPVVRSCPPLVPLPRLFADAWEHYRAGDVPGYEELRTTRYRR